MLTGGEFRDFFRIVFLCLCWYVVSSANGVFGKWILSEFPHPMTLTVIQLLSITIYSRPVVAFLRVPSLHIRWKYYLKYILPLAFAKFLSSTLSHVSIWKVPVSYAHTVKASMPLFTVMLSRFFFGEKHSYQLYLSLLPIIGGVALSTMTEVSFDVLGLGSALLSTAGFSMMNIFSKRVLRETGTHHLRLLLTLSQLAVLMFFPIWLYYDSSAVIKAFRDPNALSSSIVLLFILDGILHWLQNIIAFTILKLVAPLTYAVANVTKRISVISASLLLLKNPVTVTNVTGMAMAISGVFFYNKVKYEENKAKETLPTAVKVQKPLSLWEVNGNDYSHISLTNRSEANKRY